MEDLRALRGLEEAQGAFSRLMDEVPHRVVGLLTGIYTQVQEPKRKIRRLALQRALDGLANFRTARDLWKARRILG
jgi:hypothetical protein